MVAHLMAPSEGALDARPHLEIDARSGLPVLTELLRARARADAGLERFRVEARVRRADGQRADVRLVVDRFDPGASLFRRLTLELETDDAPGLEVRGDDVGLGGDLRDTLFRYATADPELLFLRLGAVRGVQPRELAWGQTGPLVFDGVATPGPLRQLVNEVPGIAVLCCSFARVKRAAETDRRTDPLQTPLRERMGADAWAALRASLPHDGYAVHTQLQLLCERRVRDAVRRHLPGHIVLGVG